MVMCECRTAHEALFSAVLGCRLLPEIIGAIAAYFFQYPVLQANIGLYPDIPEAVLHQRRMLYMIMIIDYNFEHEEYDECQCDV